MSTLSSLRTRATSIAAVSAVAVGASLALIPGTPASAATGDPGTLDTTFATPAMSSVVASISMQPDGKMIIVGGFENIGPNNSSYVARLNADGSIDSTFNPPLLTNGAPHAAAVLPSGSIVVGGGFTQKIVNGVTSAQGKIIRLNPNGSVQAFAPPVFPTGEITDLAIDAVNFGATPRILVGGDFTGVGGTHKYLVRLIEGGSLEPSAVPLFGASQAVGSIVVSGDKYLIGGQFIYDYGSGTDQGITRLLTEFSHDTTFNPPDISGSVRSVALAPDGKILAAGTFANIGSASGDYVVRLNSNGTYDPTFIPAALDNTAHAVAVLPNGKVVVAGEFTSANGNAAYGKLVRLNTDGSLDSTFTPPAFNADLYALAKTSDSKLIAGGFFTNLGGNASVDRIARVFNGELAAPIVPIIKTAQSANGTVKKLKVGKKKKLPKQTKQGVPQTWKTLTKSKCKIKASKLVAVKKGTCRLRIAAPTTANYLPLAVTVKVKIVK